MSARIAVADTSPLIAFDCLDLLPSLSVIYGKVLIPTAVLGEFIGREEKLHGRMTSALTTLLRTPPFEPCEDYDTAEIELFPKMGRGELEAISQAKRRQAVEVILDDRRARQLASRQGQRPIGTLRLLASLHVLDYLPDYDDAVNRLRGSIGFRATAANVMDALRAARSGI